MKKIFTYFLLGLALSFSAFANNFTLGIRLGDCPDSGSTIAPELSSAMKALNAHPEPFEKLTSTRFLGIYGLFDIKDFDFGKLDLQVESNLNNFHFAAAYSYTIELPDGLYNTSDYYSIKYHLYGFRLDIPILLMYSKPIGKRFEISAGLGPLLSIPIEAQLTTTQNGPDSDVESFSHDLNDGSTLSNFGILFDVNGKIALGKIKIALDFRYCQDITETKFVYQGEVTPIYTRRVLNVGIGLEYRF